MQCAWVAPYIGGPDDMRKGGAEVMTLGNVRVVAAFAAGLALLLLVAGCGGGGGDAPVSSGPSANQQFVKSDGRLATAAVAQTGIVTAYGPDGFAMSGNWSSTVVTEALAAIKSGKAATLVLYDAATGTEAPVTAEVVQTSSRPNDFLPGAQLPILRFTVGQLQAGQPAGTNVLEVRKRDDGNFYVVSWVIIQNVAPSGLASDLSSLGNLFVKNPSALAAYSNFAGPLATQYFGP